jgi:6-phosphogluconolactonase
MMRWVRLGIAATGLAALCLATGCGSFWVYPGTLNSSTSATGDYVYVANSYNGSSSTTESVAAFAVGTATLSEVSGSPYELSFFPTALAVNPANTILFAAGNTLIYAYAIESGGVLSVLNNGSAVGIADVVSMQVSPDGQWLLALDGNGVSVDEFQINSSTGQLAEQNGATYSLGVTAVPSGLKIAPNGDYVFLALGTAGDVVFTFDTSTGALASSQELLLTQPSTTSDNALAVGPGSTYLYIARSGTGGGLAVYSIGNNGALTEVSGSPFAAGTQPYSVVLNNAGTDVYVANRGDGTISGYSVASSGTLTALTGSPYTSGSAVTALAVDNSGNYLLAVASGGSPDLTMYSFDATIVGKLDLVTTTATGTDPTGPVAVAATH